ncbi:FAD-binding oxidoreductase [Catenovulum sp. 2E275]|uniref:FAD-dependent oxidoreductase n=1 Tax=Catenovulum sp. 2E275 TaxID=2980497 RepID=UPI0021D0BD18|nr:FAD-dependent oxidoreductase [Catenovulum sp. 2E275]MCU4674142.1 FAD-binding oxidoreductase [Catenovulum sp. 2E275]
MSSSQTLSSKTQLGFSGTEPRKIAVIGGGVAGSTIALRLAELGLDVTLFEQGPSLVNGPPICHLHAGGSFYREITDEQCLTLLNQSIDMMRVFPQAVNVRPTVIAVPIADSGSPFDILPRLKKLQKNYADLITVQPDKQVLGEPADYYCTFERSELEALAQKDLPEQITDNSDWLIPLAKHLDLDSVKYPLILVQEYGLSGFRFSATVSLAAQQMPNCQVKLNSKLVALSEQAGSKHWQLTIENQTNLTQEVLSFDYLINACGFRTGLLDNMLKAPRQRLVEFKAAYVAHWQHCQGHWPEVLFHGERGTPNGMAQLTPYPNGYFQLHGMTQDITLFKDGLVSSNAQTAQPELPSLYIDKIDKGWPEPVVKQRTQGAIQHVAKFLQAFSSARPAANPLFGAQQIPGDDPKLRTSDVSFYGDFYARTEIVKAPSALQAADTILQNLIAGGVIQQPISAHINQHYFPKTQSIDLKNVVELACKIAEQRGYPQDLALKI